MDRKGGLKGRRLQYDQFGAAVKIGRRRFEGEGGIIWSRAGQVNQVMGLEPSGDENGSLVRGGLGAWRKLLAISLIEMHQIIV